MLSHSRTPSSARPLGSGHPFQCNFAGFNLQDEIAGDFSPKDYLIVSYEDCFLWEVAATAPDQRDEQFVGRSDQRMHLLILRDPFNLFASRLKCGFADTSQRAMQTWKQHAREFLGRQAYLPHSRHRVSYNEWVMDPKCRLDLACSLGIEFTDSGFLDVPDTANGSSFDGRFFDGRATQMAVQDRWREFAYRRDYTRLFDEDALELANAAFGWTEAAEHVRTARLRRRRYVTRDLVRM